MTDFSPVKSDYRSDCPALLFLCAVTLAVLFPAVTRAQGRIEGQILNGATSLRQPRRNIPLQAPWRRCPAQRLRYRPDEHATAADARSGKIARRVLHRLPAQARHNVADRGLRGGLQRRETPSGGASILSDCPRREVYLPLDACRRLSGLH